MNEKAIKIESAQDLHDLFMNDGVFKAIEYAFRCKEFPIDRDGREYAEIARAYWQMCGVFDVSWRGKQGKPFNQAPSLPSIP